jgi:hypothetical protein
VFHGTINVIMMPEHLQLAYNITFYMHTPHTLPRDMHHLLVTLVCMQHESISAKSP